MSRRMCPLVCAGETSAFEFKVHTVRSECLLTGTLDSARAGNVLPSWPGPLSGPTALAATAIPRAASDLGPQGSRTVQRPLTKY